jgi:hypothetical protein
VREIYAIYGSVAGTVLELIGQNADEPSLRSSSDGQSKCERLVVLAIGIAVLSGIFHEPVEPPIRFRDPSGTEEPLKLPADVLFPKVRFLGESLDGRIAPRFIRVATLREDRKQLFLAIRRLESLVDHV